MDAIRVKAWLLLVGSGTCLAFGGLQPIAVLAWLHPLLLLQFLHQVRILERQWRSMLGLLLVVLLVQTLGLSISYAGEFNDPSFTLAGITSTLFVSFLVWAVLLFVFVSAVAYEHRFPAAVLAHPWAFPALWTFVWHSTAMFTPIGATGNPAVTQHGIGPLVMTAGLWGLDGILFFMALTASLVHQRLQLRQEGGTVAWSVISDDAAEKCGFSDEREEYHKLDVEEVAEEDEQFGGYQRPPELDESRGAGNGKPTIKEFSKRVKCHDRLVKIWCFILISSLLYSGIKSVVFSGGFFEKGILATAKPTVAVSCILRQPTDISDPHAKELDGPSKEFLWNATTERARAGDAFILWSETATLVDGAEGEEEVLSRARDLLLEEQNRRAELQIQERSDHGLSASNYGPYLGLAYSVERPISESRPVSSSSNVLTLMLPDGSIGFRYEKAHPVPFVELDTIAGANELKAINTPFGTVSAAICFDLQFPRLMMQAARLGVDILLQPSWTWGPMANQQFKADSFRAVENGFTLVRCSSMGQSGVLTPYNEIIDLRESTHTSVETMVLPLSPKIWTLYPFGGFLFGLAVAVLAEKYFFMTWLPLSWVLAVTTYMPGAVNHIFVGDTFDEDVLGKEPCRRYKTKTKNSTEWTVAKKPSLFSSRPTASRYPIVEQSAASMNIRMR